MTSPCLTVTRVSAGMVTARVNYPLNPDDPVIARARMLAERAGADALEAFNAWVSKNTAPAGPPPTPKAE